MEDGDYLSMDHQPASPSPSSPSLSAYLRDSAGRQDEATDLQVRVNTRRFGDAQTTPHFRVASHRIG